jgi:predicted ATPase
MQLIKSIEIKYLRSIHRLRLKQIGNLTIFSGANDVGKSNILKALNLFFNNNVDREKPLDFSQDFSLRRFNEVRRESIKGKQFIRIDIEFHRPPNYKGSLPPTFTVSQMFYRDYYQQTDNLEYQKKLGKLPNTLETARRMLTQFLNRIRFEYIPAIRDRAYFEYVLENLQETLLAKQMQKDDPIVTAVKDLNVSLTERARSLREDFQRATKIEADVSLPVDPKSLFRAFSVSTKWQDARTKKGAEQELLSLSLRGDGIQAIYIPLLLKYIADNSSLFYIWGFEEPENSVEYNLAIDLAEAFENTYSKRAQILLTTHSPAFVTLHSPRTIRYRVYMKNNSTEATQLHTLSIDPEIEQLSEDIGLFRIQEEAYNLSKERSKAYLKTREEVEQLRAERKSSTKPVVYVEGKTDVTILETAWNKLFPNKAMPYIFESCDPLRQIEGSCAGGWDTLKSLLRSVPPDNPHIDIGVFDRDKAGIDAYNGLPNYFYDLPGIEGVKVLRNHKAVAILLPIPPGKEEYAKEMNLVLEFYFSEEVLLRKTEDGKGLKFKQPDIVTKNILTGVIREIKPSDLPQDRRIVNGKKIFAKKIVPVLDPSEFESFELLFKQIDEALKNVQDPHTTPSN